MKVALIKPPLIGHTMRGTGKYTTELFKALKKQNIDIDLVEYHSNLNSFDLVHYPYFDPFFLTLPLFKKRPTIVTVHDLIPLVFPEHFPKGIKGNIKWQMQKFALKNVDEIITDSNASKKDIIRLIPYPENKINVIYLGVGKEFRQIKDSAILSKTKNKYSLPDQFILYVGDRNYNKNVDGLLMAFQKIAKDYSNIYLVLIGKGFTDLQTPPHVLKFHSLTSEEMVHIYNLSRAYIQPSFAEGFGLPVLEAMACGCPTVVSNTSSLSEIKAPKSVLIDPKNVESIKRGIIKVLTSSPQQINEIIIDGLKNAQQFSWDKCAQETIKIYKIYV